MSEPTGPAPDTGHRRRTGFLLARVGRGAWNRFEQALEPLGLRPRHLVVLLELQEHGPLTQGALLELLGFDAGSLVALLTDLEDGGLAVRRRDPADRRRHIVATTPDGLSRLKVAEQAVGAAEQDLLAVLDEGERDLLSALLHRIDSRQQLGAAPHARRLDGQRLEPAELPCQNDQTIPQGPVRRAAEPLKNHAQSAPTPSRATKPSRSATPTG